MNSFERFRNRNSKRMEARERINTHFILKGYPSTVLTNVEHEGDKVITTMVQAAVVNEQEKDKAYIYTLRDDELECGSV